MDFILRQDWVYRGPDTNTFLTNESLSKSNIQHIISGTFRDPLISDDDSEEDQHHDIDLLMRTIRNDSKANYNPIQKSKTLYTPGFRIELAYPKLSSINKECHLAGIKVLNFKSRVITHCFRNKPSNEDFVLFKSIQKKYAKEKDEYLAWARRLWLSKHCVLSLNSNVLMEQVYEADWLARITAASSLPSDYEYAAQIQMTSERKECQLVHVENLKKVNMSKIPVLTLPAMQRYQTVAYMAKEFILQPCKRHPCRIILPDEDKPTSLPMKEVHSVLAKYACANNAACIVSEHALRCMVQFDVAWNLPITVETISEAGGDRIVLVIGGDISPGKQMKRDRTERALHLMARHYFTRKFAKDYVYETTFRESSTTDSGQSRVEEKIKKVDEYSDGECSSEDEDKMFIHLGEEKSEDMKAHSTRSVKPQCRPEPPLPMNSGPGNCTATLDALTTDCTCQTVVRRGNTFKRHLDMSYTKWELRGNSADGNIPIIVHSSHKYAKDSHTEVVLNVVAEHQLEMGGAAIPHGRSRATSLAAHLREKAEVLTSRVDARNGQIISLEYTRREDLNGDLMMEAASILCSAISQLRMLKPQHYVLCHKPQHGENALLFVAHDVRCRSDQSVQKLSIAIDHNIDQNEEKKSLQVPPRLSDVLLPIHTLRNVLPLAFGYRPLQKVKLTAAAKRGAAIKLAIKEKRAAKRKRKKCNRKNQQTPTEQSPSARRGRSKDQT